MTDKTILVVEDERALSEVIRLKLENLEYKVLVARTVEEAIDFLREKQNVNAVWLDHYLLGKESGLDLVAEIKSDNSNYKNIPVFVVSNTASHDKVQSYMQLGVDKYYVKSNHRLDEIISDIEKVI